MAIEVSINGEHATIPLEKPTVLELLAQQNVDSPEMVSVQLNGKILRKVELERTTVSAGDTIEFLYFMGGG
jgi:sulfur carrier protein